MWRQKIKKSSKNGEIIKLHGNELLCSRDIWTINSVSDKLFRWFGITFTEMPRVLDRMGFQNKEYVIYAKEITNSKITMIIQTKSQTVTLEIMREYSIAPYPTWKLTDEDGTSKVYSVEKKLIVEQLSIESDDDLA